MLFVALATAGKQYIADFNPKELAKTAWAFATAGHHDLSQFAVFATAVQRRVREFTQN